METTVRIFIATLVAILFVSAAPGLEAFGASAPGGELRLSGDQGEHYDKVASLASEPSLSLALDLPPSEFFVTEEPEPDSGDFELKMPEEELPDPDIPLTLNSKVEYFISYFQTNCRDVFARWLSRSERYIPMMKQVLD